MKRRKQRRIIGLKRAAVTLLAFVMLLSICSPGLTTLATQLDTPDTGLDSPNLLQTAGENSDDTGTDGSGENSGDSGNDGSGENSGDSGNGGSGENSGDSGTDGSGENSGDSGTDGSGENSVDSGTDSSGENSGDSGNDGSGENSGDSGTDGSGENPVDSGTDGSGENSGDSGTDGSGENSGDSGNDGSGENSGDSGSNGSGENSGDSGNDGSGENSVDSGTDGSGENSGDSGSNGSGENSESGTESDSAGTEGTEETGAARLNAYLNQLAKLEEEATYLEADEEVLDNFYFDGLLAVWDAAQEDWGNDLLTDEQMDEINLKAYGIKMYLQNELHYVDGDIVTYDINIVPSDTANNVTVKVFNYNNDVNSEGLGPLGYNFFQGDYTDDEKKGSVDGVYSASHDNYNKNNKPVMSKTLVNGYPHVESKAAGSEVNISGSMDYLFNKDHQVGEDMLNGGGLFQQDANGYFYYDSMWNAASYSDGKFTLYDTVVRPKYTADTGSDIQRSNFLPFNDATKATVDCKIGETGVQGAKLNDPVDLWFGMTVDFSFFMPKDGKIGNAPMIFDFHGDDDVFVYIDDVLVLDIGGTHASQSGTINFNTGEVVYPNVKTNLKTLFEAAGKTDVAFNENGTFVDYTSHTLKFYYMERGGNISYCRLRFNMPTIPDNSLLVGKELEIDSDKSTTDLEGYLDSKYDYQFRVWKCNEAGGDPQLLAKEGDTYDILQNGQKVGTGTVGENGIFTLKAGTFAQFANLLENDIFLRHYYVEEILPKEIHEQYGDIEFKIDGANDTSITGIEEGDYVHYYSSVIPVSEDTNQKNSATVLYTNKVYTDKLSILRITKEVSAGSVSTDAEFPIQIKLGGEVLPTGSEYIVNGTKKTSEANGIIKLKGGETAMLADGIISGTEFAVTEILSGDQATIWNASYSGTVTDSNGANDLTGTKNISGTFPLDSTVHVTVTNRSYDLSCEIPVTKTYLGNTNATKNFTFALKDSGGNIIDGAQTTITVTDENPTTGFITLGYKSDVEIGTYTYKLCEVVDENDLETNYDPSIYDVQVTVSEENGKKTAVVESITLNDEDYEAAAFVNHRTTQVAVSKTVNGNMGDQSKAFDFTATLSGGDYSFAGVTYSINGGETLSAGTETECTFNLKHGDSITFIDLPIGATFTVTETSYSKSGYVTTVDGETGSSKVITLAETNSNIAFVNTKDVTIDTGVLLDTLPYILILGVVAVGAVLLIKKRRNRDDD